MLLEARFAIAIGSFFGWYWLFGHTEMEQPWIFLLALLCAVCLSVIDLIFVVAVDAIAGGSDW